MRVVRAVTFLFHGVINKLQSRLTWLYYRYACGWRGHCSVTIAVLQSPSASKITSCSFTVDSRLL